MLPDVDDELLFDCLDEDFFDELGAPEAAAAAAACCMANNSLCNCTGSYADPGGGGN